MGRREEGAGAQVEDVTAEQGGWGGALQHAVLRTEPQLCGGK